MHAHSSRPCAIEMRDRAGFRPVLKTVLITAGITVFMLGYFFLLHHPTGDVFEMPVTAVDRYVPFQPAWLTVYVTLWGYVSLAPGLQRDLRGIGHYAGWAGAMCFVALMCFAFLPTRMLHDASETGGFPGYAFLRGVDKAGNTCPSMHVAAAIFTALRLDAIFRYARTPRFWRVVNAVWCAAIVWSTMAIRQHVFCDVVAGALLGVAFAVASLRYAPDGVP